jgi:hypothetical protein
VSADTGLVTCTDVTPLGGVLNTSASASGSWITGDFATSAQASANGNGNIKAEGTDTFVIAGYITVPSGMTSASVTLGLTGLSGTATGLAGSNNPDAAWNEITLKMIVGGSGGTSATSIACMNFVSYISACPGGGFGLGFGPGALAPITLPVSGYEYLSIEIDLQSGAYSNAIANGTTTGSNFGSSGMTVDPLYLTLPARATYDSGVAGLLSGAAPVATGTPEPASFLVIGAGLLVVGILRRRAG